jgi:hypothetical protein
MLILVIYSVGLFFSGIIEMQYFDGTNSQISNLVDPLGDPVAKVRIVWDMSWFDFAMFKNVDGTANELAPLRWLLMVLSAAFWLNILMGLVAGISSAVRRLTGLG